MFRISLSLSIFPSCFYVYYYYFSPRFMKLILLLLLCNAQSCRRSDSGRSFVTPYTHCPPGHTAPCPFPYFKRSIGCTHTDQILPYTYVYYIYMDILYQYLYINTVYRVYSNRVYLCIPSVRACNHKGFNVENY